MIRARSQLLRLLQVLFERHLRGLYRWGEVEIGAAENALPEPGRRHNKFGKYRESVTVMFGPFVLTIESPNEKPPLGQISLDTMGDRHLFNSLDEADFDKVGSIIVKYHKEFSNV